MQMNTKYSLTSGKALPLIICLFILPNKSIAQSEKEKEKFADCIISGMKGTSSDEAAKAIVAACTLKHMSPKEKESAAQNPTQILCGGYTFDRNQYGHFNFPVPNNFGSVRIVNIIWKKDMETGYQREFRTYIEHNYPFQIQGFFLQGHDSEGKDDASYYCSGHVGTGAVGYGRCAHVQESSKTFSIKSVLTTQGFVYDIAKSLKMC